MIAHHEWLQKVWIMKVDFPTSKIGTARINLVINYLSLTCNLFAGILHLQCLLACGLSQESWIAAHSHVSIWSVFLLEADYMGSKMTIYPVKL